MDGEQQGHSSRWQIRLPSSTDELPRLRAWLRRLLRHLKVSDSEIQDVVLSTHEVVINAMGHGNQFDPTKQVTVTVEIGTEGGFGGTLRRPREARNRDGGTQADDHDHDHQLDQREAVRVR